MVPPNRFRPNLAALAIATLAQLLDAVGLHRTPAEARALLPDVPWQESADRMMNRYYLSADDTFSLGEMRFSARIADGDHGGQSIDAVWRGHGYTFEACQAQLALLVAELERRYGPLPLAQDPPGHPGDIEWHGKLSTDGGLEVEGGGQYFGVATLLGEARDCGAHFSLVDTRSKPRRVNEAPSILVAPPPPRP